MLQICIHDKKLYRLSISLFEGCSSHTFLVRMRERPFQVHSNELGSQISFGGQRYSNAEGPPPINLDVFCIARQEEIFQHFNISLAYLAAENL